MTRALTSDGPVRKLSPAAKGSISEHVATAWLLAKGYDVFRNVSPAGRADLIAVNWDRDETIRVDVKSAGFRLNGKGRQSRGLAERDRYASEKDQLNQGFDIKYLVVSEDGQCQWLDEMIPSNDNKPEIPKEPTYWRCKKTMQRFLVPGFKMTDREWYFFCHWLLRAHPDYIVPFSEQFVREISAAGIGFRRPKIDHKRIGVLRKLFAHVYGKIKDADQLEEVE